MATYRGNDRAEEIDKRTTEIINKYRSAGRSALIPPRNTTTIKPAPPLSNKDILISNTPMIEVFQALVKGITKLVGLISSFSEKTATVKEYMPPVIQEEAVNVKIKKPVIKAEPTIDNFITNKSNPDAVREWDNMYATRQQESLHGKARSTSPIDSREGRHGWIQAYNATHANDFDDDPLIPTRNRSNGITFKLKDPKGSVPASPETFLLGYSRLDGCGIYRYYGQDIEAIKQHYNIEELYE